MSETKEAIERRTDDAFAASAWQDPRAEYRALLRRIRERDTAAFDDAVRLYETRVVAALADDAVDPVAAWLDYGRRLAQLAGGGRAVTVDEQGRAGELRSDAPIIAPTLLLQLPADESAAAFVVAVPREPSPAQLATMALLAAGAQTLPA